MFKHTNVSHCDLASHGEQRYVTEHHFTMCVAVHVYVSHLTLSQLGLGEGLFGRPKAQLSADHAGCTDVPQVVTHGTPLPLLQHLNAALPDPGPRLQTHDWLRGKMESLGEKWEFVN